jgi:hypothetical protein
MEIEQVESQLLEISSTTSPFDITGFTAKFAENQIRSEAFPPHSWYSCMAEICENDTITILKFDFHSLNYSILIGWSAMISIRVHATRGFNSFFELFMIWI